VANKSKRIEDKVDLVENSSVIYVPMLSLPDLMMRNHHWSCIVVGSSNRVCTESLKYRLYTLWSCCGPIACSQAIAVDSKIAPLLLCVSSISRRALCMCSQSWYVMFQHFVMNRIAHFSPRFFDSMLV